MGISALRVSALLCNCLNLDLLDLGMIGFCMGGLHGRFNRAIPYSGRYSPFRACPAGTKSVSDGQRPSIRIVSDCVGFTWFDFVFVLK